MSEFKLSLNTSTIKPVGLLDKIRLVGEAGYDGIELWINDVYEHVGRGGEVSDVEALLAEYKLEVPCMIALRQWGEASQLEYPLMLEEAQRRMELAHRLGATWVVATPPRDACDFDQLAGRYRDLLDLGRKIGIKPTFEYISFFGSARKLEDAWKVVQAVDDDDATIIVDAFHTWNSGSDPHLLEEIPANRVAHYHIDDAAPDMPAETQTDPDRVMIGEGPIDLAREIKQLRQINYKGWISLELFNRDLWQQDPATVISDGKARLEQLLAG